MGKSLPTHKLQQFAQIISTNNNHKPVRPTQLKPVSKTRPDSLKLSVRKMTEESSTRRQPLSDVVADCVKRWFQDTLKEAKAGDVTMQVLVGQMYHSGYGVGKDDHKGRAWIGRASRSRSSALKVGDKRPGYNASDSDSEEVAE